MDANLFWLNVEQWAKIVPYFADEPAWPCAQGRSTHPERIMHVLKIGCRWQDCPKEYGPHKIVYNRFAR